MTPEISEFSYGFALTNEIVGWTSISAAPLFPSLIEEGKQGGGYDVKLQTPGIALYLQFKRADCMVRGTARELSEHNLPLSLPFYRFKITEARKSDQHELLLSLDEGPDLVFYAAPRFHELAEIDDAWAANLVANRSIFVRPTDIGSLDHKSHHVAYDGRGAWLCSEPNRIKFLRASDVLREIQTKLREETEPLVERLPQILDSANAARKRAEARITDRKYAQRETGVIFQKASREERDFDFDERIEVRQPAKRLSAAEQTLRELSDNAARVFNSQLVILQKISDE